MASSSSFFNLSVILLGLAGTLSVVQGIRCFQCGTYIITSVTPCRNLTIATLNECPPESTHCSKYSGPAMEVYGCEKNCEEKVQNSFEIHCCNEDRCNGVEGVVRKSSSALLVFGVLLSATLSLTASFTSSTSSLRL